MRGDSDRDIKVGIKTGNFLNMNSKEDMFTGFRTLPINTCILQEGKKRSSEEEGRKEAESQESSGRKKR
jgi:hypothetical protein